MDEIYFGLRSRDIRALAYQLSVRKDITNPFSAENEVPGKKWLRGCMKRYEELSFRVPEKLSLARAKAFTRSKVEIFFAMIKTELDAIEHDTTRFYNVDETGIIVVQGK